MTALTASDVLQTPAPMRNRVSRRGLGAWAILITLAYVLLWSAQWYPLSDSSLYLSLARSVAQGKGLTFMGDRVDLVPPLTPLFLGLLIKLGAGIGAIQAVLTAFMLIAHGLCFLTLRRWLNDERLALGATVATALSYWVFANAFCIMSEPLCIMLMWGGFLVLAHITNEHRWRWAMVIAACALLVLAAANRDAAILLMPGPVLGMVLKCRWSKQSIVWGLLFAAVFAGWFMYRYPPRLLKTGPFSKWFAPSPASRPTVAVDPENDNDVAPREGRYQPKWMIGVPRDHHMLTQPPVLGGRWIAEGMVMPSVVVFESRSHAVKVLGTIVALLTFLAAALGAVLMLRKGHWWILGALLYFAAIWLQWGTRIKARYMIPILPVLILALWHALSFIATSIIGRRGKTGLEAGVERWSLTALVGVVIAGNVLPWAIEFHIRHVAGEDFYDIARRGAYRQLVDIGAYLQQNAPAEQSVWTNAGAHRRIAYFLGGRKIETSQLTVPNWSECDLYFAAPRHATSRPATAPATAPATQPARRRRGMTPQERRDAFFKAVDSSAHYVIMYVEEPAKGYAWPAWHWPRKAADARVEWWRLYERRPDSTWRRVEVAPSRAYISRIPPMGK